MKKEKLVLVLAIALCLSVIVNFALAVKNSSMSEDLDYFKMANDKYVSERLDLAQAYVIGVKGMFADQSGLLSDYFNASSMDKADIAAQWKEVYEQLDHNIDTIGNILLQDPTMK